MSFTASTVRYVLYEGGPARFLYAIGNTPARAVLPAGDGPLDGPLKVLLLGCGDVRNALVSAPALLQLQTGKPLRSSAKAKHQQQQQQQQQPQIEIHLNDLSDVILARDVVLLCIAASIDPTSDGDLQYLWAVWFNAVLSQTHRQRLNQLLQQLLSGELPQHITLAEGPTPPAGPSSSLTQLLSDRLRAIWQGWLGCQKTPMAVEQERRAFVLSTYNNRRMAQGLGAIKWEQYVEDNSVEPVLDKIVADAYNLPPSTQAAMSAELGAFLKHGSITSSEAACQGSDVNPTLLDEACAWRVHDSCWPFEMFPALTPQQLKGVGPAPLPGLLTRSAQAALAAMIKQYQAAAASPAAVGFVLHGGDGVALCAAGSSLVMLYGSRPLTAPMWETMLVC